MYSISTLEAEVCKIMVPAGSVVWRGLCTASEMAASLRGVRGGSSHHRRASKPHVVSETFL